MKILNFLDLPQFSDIVPSHTSESNIFPLLQRHWPEPKSRKFSCKLDVYGLTKLLLQFRALANCDQHSWGQNAGRNHISESITSRKSLNRITWCSVIITDSNFLTLLNSFNLIFQQKNFSLLFTVANTSPLRLWAPSSPPNSHRATEPWGLCDFSKKVSIRREFINRQQKKNCRESTSRRAEITEKIHHNHTRMNFVYQWSDKQSARRERLINLTKEIQFTYRERE